MKIQNQQPRLPSPLPKPSPQVPEPSPVRDAFVHVGKEMSQEAIVGIAMAGLVSVSDSLGHPAAGRSLVAGLGATRGYFRYRDSASEALGNSALGCALAVTLGASTALMTGMSGNVVYGAGFGALLGLAQAPKTYRSEG